MFPPLKVELFDLDPNTTYTLYMDMIPVDKYRYKYQNSAWVRCFEEECSPTRLYMHPDSPALGSHWMNMVINFYKLKLTNNQLDKQGHVSWWMINVKFFEYLFWEGKIKCAWEENAQLWYITQ